MKYHNDRYPHASSYRDRHGKRRWRYRKKGFTAELGIDYGSDEFEGRYNDALKNQKSKRGAGASRTVARSFDQLVAHFYELKFPGLEEITKRDYRATIEPLRRLHGHRSVAGMKIGNVMTMKARMSSTPMQANKMLKRLSQLMDLAVRLEWRTDNPVKGVEKYRTDSRGYHTWDEGEIARFYDKYKLGSPAYLAITLILCTGASRADACKLGVHSLKDGRLSYRRNKTKKNPKGILVDIPIHTMLAEALETVPVDAFTFLQTPQGKARSPEGLGSGFATWTKAAGLTNCSAHGLRKAICRRLAEAECTPHEIMSISGHITLAEAQRYCQEFGRKDLSDSAMEKLERGSFGEQNLTNHPKRFVKKTGNALKRKYK